MPVNIVTFQYIQCEDGLVSGSILFGKIIREKERAENNDKKKAVTKISCTRER